MYLKQFAVFLRNPDVEKVRLKDVMEHFEYLKILGWHQNSFMPRAMAYRKFFEFYQHMGLNVIDPWLIPIPRKKYTMPRIASEENYKKLLDAFPKYSTDPRYIRNRAIVNLLWDTGARNNEICSLNISDLDFEEMKAVIKTAKSKGRRPVREIFWTEDTSDSLKAWIKKREHLQEMMNIEEEDALFISICNTAAGKRLNIKGLGEALRRACNRADIPYQNAHSFRHHMGHHIIKEGGSNSDVSNILGHSSLESSYIYTQMNNVELKDRYQKFMAKKTKASGGLMLTIHENSIDYKHAKKRKTNQYQSRTASSRLSR